MLSSPYTAQTFRTALIRRGFAMACIVLCAMQSAAAQVFIIDTKGGASTEEFVQEFMQACSACGEIAYHDGEGDPKRLREAAKAVAAAQDPIVVAVGSPAANAVLDASGSVRLVAALAPNVERGGGDDRICKLPSSLSFESVVDLARALAGPDAKIAIIGGDSAVAEYGKPPPGCSENCLSYIVPEPGELPDVVDRAYASADFIVFLKDGYVINRHSADFIIKQAIAKNKPTLSFSKSLADRGLTFAISPDVSAQAAYAAKAVLVMQSGRQPAVAEHVDLFKLYVNCRALERSTAHKTDFAGDDLCKKKSLNIGAARLISIEAS